MTVEDSRKFAELIDIAMEVLDEIRQKMAGPSEKMDTASSLHGPAIRPEKFIGAGEAAHRYGCSDDSIRRHAKLNSVQTILVGSASSLQCVNLTK